MPAGHGVDFVLVRLEFTAIRHIGRWHFVGSSLVCGSYAGPRGLARTGDGRDIGRCRHRFMPPLCRRRWYRCGGVDRRHATALVTVCISRDFIYLAVGLSRLVVDICLLAQVGVSVVCFSLEMLCHENFQKAKIMVDKPLGYII